MQESDKKKKGQKKTTEKIVRNSYGDEIHVFDGPNGPARIKELHMSAWLTTGEQYCPDCHNLMEHQVHGYWECPICEYSITDDEAAAGEGYPTMAATYESDYGEPLPEQFGDLPEGCDGCGGPYPDCKDSCPIFDD